MKTLNVLWADDDLDDLELFCSIAREQIPGLRIISVHNGREALDYLEKAVGTERAPCLVVLDMNMPLLSGRETIILMKNDETFRGLPCIVFTTSSSPLDKLFCQKMGVEMFTKPVNVVRLREFSQTILNYCGSND